MNYKQQMAAASGLIGMGFTMMSLWKSAIYYGKFLFKAADEITNLRAPCELIFV